jgi:membrane protein required for colicin V production
MAGLDWIVLAVLLVSAGIGAYRGVIKEVFSLGAWVAGVFAAWLYGETVIQALSGGGAVRGPMQVILGYVLAFFTAFIAITLLSFVLRKTLDAIGLGPLDRGLGLVFGVGRAVLIVTLLGVLAALAKVTTAPWWKEALSANVVETAVLAVRPFLPASVAARVQFSEKSAFLVVFVPTPQIVLASGAA